MPVEEARLLVEGGLPAAAAPFLTFRPRAVVASYDGLLARAISEFVEIGFTGSGDPVCVKPGGVIVYVDHDDPGREVFMNSSPSQLVRCLLEYRSFIRGVGGGSGPGGGRESLASAILEIDRAALADGTFWSDETAALGEE